MATSLLDQQFKRMGARAKVRTESSTRWSVADGFGIDIRRDENGEFFDFAFGDQAKISSVEVLQVVPKDRHLLLMVRRPGDRGKQIKEKFLCGHDERHWFVAAIPEDAPVSTVEAAKTALKPEEVLHRETMTSLPASRRHSRHNEAFKRQGEWFFLPALALNPPKNMIFKNEPFNRGRGKFHYAQEAYRQGGTAVYFNAGRTLSVGEYEKLDQKEKNQPWRRMVENAELYVRGKITHEDHATLILDGWHKVLMNLEHRSRAMATVRFLD